MLTARTLAPLPTATALAALGALWLPQGTLAQGTPPEMSPQEREAYQMGQEMGFVCNPARHRAMTGSESMIERDAGPLSGTAVFLRTAEGTFLVLEGYDESQAGHCLVLAWFGGELEPGRYDIRRLSYAAMEAELEAREHSFFIFSAIRSPAESATLVAESGSLEVRGMQAGSVSGSFELTGFTINSQERVDDVAFEGSFTALEPDP